MCNVAQQVNVTLLGPSHCFIEQYGSCSYFLCQLCEFINDYISTKLEARFNSLKLLKKHSTQPPPAHWLLACHIHVLTDVEKNIQQSRILVKDF